MDTKACWGPPSQSTLTKEVRDGVLTIMARCGEEEGLVNVGLDGCYPDIAITAPPAA